MSKVIWCWRCEQDVPMLEDHEWELIVPFLQDPVAQIKAYLATHNCTLIEARANYGVEAMRLYKTITGVEPAHPDLLWHHRLSLFGPPCHICAKPLRTPRAKLCMACGAKRQNDLEQAQVTP